MGVNMEKTKTAYTLFLDWINSVDMRQKEIASSLGTSPAMVSRWKVKERDPNRMARVVIDLVSGGAVPRDIPWT